jgi:hypothetical protein
MTPQPPPITEDEMNELVEAIQDDGFIVADAEVDSLRLSLWQAFTGQTQPIEWLWQHRLADWDWTLWIED